MQITGKNEASVFCGLLLVAAFGTESGKEGDSIVAGGTDAGSIIPDLLRFQSLSATTAIVRSEDAVSASRAGWILEGCEWWDKNPKSQADHD